MEREQGGQNRQGRNGVGAFDWEAPGADVPSACAPCSGAPDAGRRNAVSDGIAFAGRM
jgi:hypothetical protein